MQHYKIPPLINEYEFEALCYHLFFHETPYRYVKMHGRRGQPQNGVDVYMQCICDLSWIGIQCKVRNTSAGLTKKDIEIEIDKARKFTPKISKFWIYTTCDRDVKIQEFLRELQASNNLPFELDLFFWDDIIAMLEKNVFVYRQFFPLYFIVDGQFDGAFGVGKLFTFVDDVTHTKYDFMITFFKEKKEEKEMVVSSDYFRNRYYLTDLNTMKCARLFDECSFLHELEKIIDSRYDVLVLSDWIVEQTLEKIANSTLQEYRYFYDNEQSHGYRRRARKMKDDDDEYLYSEVNYS